MSTPLPPTLTDTDFLFSGTCWDCQTPSSALNVWNRCRTCQGSGHPDRPEPTPPVDPPTSGAR